MDDINQIFNEYKNCNDKAECQKIIKNLCFNIFKNESDNYAECVLDKNFLNDFSKGLFTDYLNFLYDFNNRSILSFDLLLNNEFINSVANNNDLSSYNKINDFITASEFIKNDILKYINNSINIYISKYKNISKKYEYTNFNNTKFEFNGTYFEKDNIQLFNINISKFNIFENDLDKATKFVKQLQEIYKDEDIKMLCANLCVSCANDWYNETYSIEDIYNILENSAMEVNVNLNEDSLMLSIWFNLKEKSIIDFGGHNPMLELYLDKSKNKCFIE